MVTVQNWIHRNADMGSNTACAGAVPMPLRVAIATLDFQPSIGTTISTG